VEKIRAKPILLNVYADMSHFQIFTLTHWIARQGGGRRQFAVAAIPELRVPSA
jgi:hypothetical protein